MLSFIRETLAAAIYGAERFYIGFRCFNMVGGERARKARAEMIARAEARLTRLTGWSE